MSHSQQKVNVCFPVIVFYSTRGDLRTECIREASINTNIDEQLLQVLPTITKPHGWGLPNSARFKAFWFDQDDWIPDPRRTVSTLDTGRLLAVVQDTVAGRGIPFFKAWAQGVPTYREWVDKASSQGSSLSDVVNPEVSIMGVKLNLGKAWALISGWVKRRRYQRSG